MPEPDALVVPPDSIYKRSDQIVARRVADEFLLVPLVGRGANLDAIYSLNRVGTFIWERLDGSATGHDIISALCEHFDVTSSEAETDYHDFVMTLLGIKAVVGTKDG
jgi:hypothetical protein